MKNGKCPRCGAKDIQKVKNTGGHRNMRPLAAFSIVKLDEYVCCGCGLVETYVADMNDVEKIRDKCTKVETSE